MPRSYLFAMAIPFCLLAGCASSPLPPSLSSAEADRLSELPLPYSVAVAPYEYPIYSDKLATALKATGLFSQVLPISEFKGTPDLVATVDVPIYGTATIPIATLASVGVIPTVVDENHGFVFSLAPSSNRSKKVIVDASYSGPTTLGWAAIAVNVLPGFTFSDPEQSERFRRMLSYRTVVALLPEKAAVQR